MSRPGRHFLTIAGLVLVASSVGRAQVGEVPVLASVYPPGATVGTVVEWAIAGRNLPKVGTIRISGGGVDILEFRVKNETSATARVRVDPAALEGYREVRIEGASGVSNLAIVRVDRLPQVVEVEPNDDPLKAQVVGVGTVVAGVLRPRDLDHYQVQGTPGERVTLDLEARRLGISIAPVVTVSSVKGTCLAQGRESRGGDRDCRMTIVVPPEGAFVVQVRDNVFGGHDLARYRLRFDPAPFATALFPLGGVKGRTIEVELSGGNLPFPLRKSVSLPDLSGSYLDPGDFQGPERPVAGPGGKLVVGDGPEFEEPFRSPSCSPPEVLIGQTINGRIAQAGEVDGYRFKIKAGQKIRARVVADAIGSWLDSVLTIRDETGAMLAENDDSRAPSPPDRPRVVSVAGIPEPSADSTIEYEAKADGTLTIEVADRFGEGGLEYGYRLAIGPPRPDFSVTLLLGNANASSRSLRNLNQARSVRTSPGQFGVFNLRPGTSVPINFVVTPEGRPGPLEVRAEGLPEGVTAEPVVVRLGSDDDASTVADFLLIRVAAYARPYLSEFRIVATTTGSGDRLEREGSATIGIDSVAVSDRPITRALTRFPLRILGEATPLFIGPPAPPSLREVEVAGSLLLGDQLDLPLGFSGIFSAEDGSTLEAKIEGIGMSARVVHLTGRTANSEGRMVDPTVRVVASIDAHPGLHIVLVTFTPVVGPPVEREVKVEARVPIEVRSLAGSVTLRPGDETTFPIEIHREPGFEGEVEVWLEDLPTGVRAGPVVATGSGTSKVEVRLSMVAEAEQLVGETGLRVVGMARMPGGNVRIDSKVRPMIRARPAEN